MKYQINVSKRAKSNFIEIQRYTVHNFGKRQSDKYSKKLEKAIQNLASNPNLGRTHKNLPDSYRMLSIERHSIVYVIRGDMINILSILHEKMTLKNKF